MKEVCEHCGARMRKYWCKMTSGLAGSLVKFYIVLNQKGENSVHLQNDMLGDNKLTQFEYNNFQKLGFHALVAKTKDSGSWLLTHRGALFLKGELAIPSEVQTFRGKVVAHSQREVFIKDVVNKLPRFESRADINFEYVVPEDVPTIQKIIKRRKSKFPTCPNDGSVLAVNVITSPGKNKNSLNFTREYYCKQCEFKETWV